MIKKILKASWLIIAVVFMYLPIIVLAVYSFTDTAIIGAWADFHLIIIKYCLRLLNC